MQLYLTYPTKPLLECMKIKGYIYMNQSPLCASKFQKHQAHRTTKIFSLTTIGKAVNILSFLAPWGSPGYK